MLAAQRIGRLSLGTKNRANLVGDFLGDRPQPLEETEDLFPLLIPPRGLPLMGGSALKSRRFSPQVPGGPNLRTGCLLFSTVGNPSEPRMSILSLFFLRCSSSNRLQAPLSHGFVIPPSLSITVCIRVVQEPCPAAAALQYSTLSYYQSGQAKPQAESPVLRDIN